MTNHIRSNREPGPWTILESEYVIKRWWMNLRVDHIRLATGVELDEFHVLEYPDWTCIVCRTESNGIVMVEQYRHGLAEIIRELPAGGVSESEPPIVAAKRELLEETGYVADNWQFLGRYAPEPSRHTNWAHFFFADGGRRVTDLQLDESEDMRAFEIPISEVRKLVDQGSLVHGVQLSALLIADRKGLLD